MPILPPPHAVSILPFVLPAATFVSFLLHQCPKRQERLQIVPQASTGREFNGRRTDARYGRLFEGFETTDKSA